MAFISLGEDGSLTVQCPLKDKQVVKDVGGSWDSIYKVWSVAFTMSNVEHLADKLPDVGFSDGVVRRVEEQQEKEDKLRRLIEMSNANAPVRLKIPGLKLPLHNYQRYGVMFGSVNGEGVLLADEMGLGKSVQGISMGLLLKSRGMADKVLVVTPASLKWNWPLEIAKFTDEPYIVIDGAADKRIAQWLDDRPTFYIVNYELLLEDLFGGKKLKPKSGENEVQKLKREARMARTRRRMRMLRNIKECRWGALIVDEAHALKNRNSIRSKNVKSLRAGFRMALTGTPLDGRLEELHSLMHFVCPGLLESFPRFMQKYTVVDREGAVTGYKNIGEMNERIRPYFIRRLKKDVLDDLPDNIYSNRVVQLSGAERKIYDDLADRGHEVTEDADALVAILRCKQFCDHPSLIEEHCRSSKLEMFVEVLQEVVVENGHKVLVFSQYAEMVKVLMRTFDEMGLKYMCIWGETPKKERADMQEKFNTDKSIDLMVGTEAMSMGLNFTAADYVINYDDNWAPAYMAQREGRAHRIGQRNVVTVVNFICRNTIEERIREVLYSKSKVSAEALGDDIEDAVLRRLGPQELAKLL